MDKLGIHEVVIECAPITKPIATTKILKWGETSALHCASCGQIGHLRSSSRLCPYNRANRVDMDGDLEMADSTNNGNYDYNIARRGTHENEPPRLDIGAMILKCAFCGAFMWKEKKISGALTEPRFQFCCGSSKYIDKLL